MATITPGSFTGIIDQQFIIEALEGPKHPDTYLDRFPDGLYNKAPESHLVRFLYSMLGPSGIGWLRKNTFDARLELESQGLELFNLDDFYGNPLAFGRILEEVYNQDVSGLLPKDEWDAIRVKDAAYRSRAVDFVNGARAGNTPFGMRLVARSGLGHEAEIVENYKFLFDQYSDDPIGIPHFGRTYLTNEMIVLPREETAQSEIQQIKITGTPTGGTFVLWYNGQNTSALPYNVDVFTLEDALQALPAIGPTGVVVNGGPTTFTVRYIGHLAKTDTPQLTATVSFTGGTNADVKIGTIEDGIPPLDETRVIGARDSHYLQTALDRIKPVTVFPTTASANSRRQRQQWQSAFSSSEHSEIIRYVTGQSGITWPPLDSNHWIERLVEKEAPRVAGDMQFHYQGFHNINTITSSSDHIGRFEGPQTRLPGYEYLKVNKDDTLVFASDRALADYYEPLTVTTASDASSTSSTNYINGVYPTDYLGLSGSPTVKYTEEQFWASAQQPDGEETLIIDFGVVRAVNYLLFEVSRKPLGVRVAIDTLNQGNTRQWVDVTPNGTFTASISYDPHQNPWQLAEFNFTDRLGEIALARYLRITLDRQNDGTFLFNNLTQTQESWTIEVRNLRVGRNVVNY